MWRKLQEFSGHAAPVYACAADDQWIYSTAGDRFVTRWNPETGSQDAFAIKLDSPSYVIGLCEQQPLLIIGCANGTIIAIDKTTKTLIWEHNFRGKALFSCIDCPEEGFIILGDAEGELLVVDYSGTLLAGFALNCGKIRQLKRYDNRLFAACQDGTWRLFDLPSLNELVVQKAHEGGTNAVLLFPSAHTLLTGGKDGHLRLWDLITLQELQSIPAHYQTIYGLEACGVASFVTTSMDKTIKIWNTDELKVIQRIEFKQGGHNRSVNGCVSINAGRFVTFSDDKKIILWTSGPVRF